DPASIRLVAVSKGFGPEHIRAAAAAGQRDFGENRVQEALQKIGAAADLGITWHLVGHLQSNKVRKAVGPFRWIHSVDRAELLVRLEQAAAAAGAPLRVLVQVDLAGEPTKFGAPPAEARRIVEAAAGCRAVELAGLMVLPPFAEDPEVVRPYFARLRELRDEFVREGAAPAGALAELSMGMSHDFEVAIEEGATMVRVGTAIFGPRPETAGGVRA
ncbi:MAG TPA: YggS family pyridoxal phosphate-dependent enzyme, partial [Vicinamibacterales bacterium]|nr:YggS family pyridoxal phosphate-dependent enzyme [Vicinamibacterales bacterium]